MSLPRSALCRLIFWLDAGFGSLHQNPRTKAEDFRDPKEDRHREALVVLHIPIQRRAPNAQGISQILLLHVALREFDAYLLG